MHDEEAALEAGNNVRQGLASAMRYAGEDTAYDPVLSSAQATFERRFAQAERSPTGKTVALRSLLQALERGATIDDLQRGIDAFRTFYGE